MRSHDLPRGEPLIPWYFETENKESEDLGGTTSRQLLREPWRIYWPPRSKHVLDIWLRSEYAEVLSWRFDPARPFDRPWRTWTKSALAVAERGTAPVEAKFAAERTSCEGSIFPPACGKPRTSLLPGPGTHAKRIEFLDSYIEALRLPYVTPASFPYLASSDLYHNEKPYLSRLPYAAELKRTNILTESHPIQIFDVSGNEDSFSIDGSGFHFAKCPIPMEQWNDLSVRSGYIPRLTEWLKRYLKCQRVFVYAYNFRGQNPLGVEKKSLKTPFLRAHCDATPDSCFKRLQLYFPDEAQSLMRDRVRFLNIWRAISTPVQDCPLAFCDFRSIQAEDLVPADIIFPHYNDEAYEILHRPAHRWFYKRGMQWDDVALFKLGDNASNVAQLSPHSAFMDPSVPKDTPSRVSLEVRAIVIG